MINPELNLHAHEEWRVCRIARSLFTRQHTFILRSLEVAKPRGNRCIGLKCYMHLGINDVEALGNFQNLWTILNRNLTVQDTSRDLVARRPITWWIESSCRTDLNEWCCGEFISICVIDWDCKTSYLKRWLVLFVIFCTVVLVWFDKALYCILIKLVSSRRHMECVGEIISTFTTCCSWIRTEMKHT